MASSIGAFIHELMSAKGTPYVWGGTSLQNGVDCSGLVYRAAQLAGIQGVGRTTYQQFAQGHPVKMNQLQPGDLVFSHWGSEQGPGHVSIYIGNGHIIEAAQTGVPVHVVPISVLNGHIVGARTLAGVAPGQHAPDASHFAAQQMAYFQQARPIQLPQLPQIGTAQQALQKATLASTPPLAASPSLSGAAQPQAGQASSGFASQLGSIHDQLLKKIG